MADKPPQGALVGYVEGLWGTKTRLVPKQIVAVGTTSSQVCKNNPRRFSLTVVNRGSGQVDLDWNPSLSLGDGIPLQSLGSLTLTAFEDGEQVGYDLYAISSAAGNNLAVYEVEAI